MLVTKKQKAEIIDSLTDKLSKSTTLIFAHFAKISVEKIKELRKNLKIKGADFKVVKKTLLGLALEKAKVDVKEINFKKAHDTVGVVLGGDDQVQSARTVSLFSRAKGNDAFKVLGGIFSGQFAEKEKIAALAKMSSKEELYARFLGQLKAPLSRLAYALKMISEKKQIIS